MFKKSLIALSATLLAATSTFVHGQIAQAPLVKQSESVSPNIMYVFDDSGSMGERAIYQYGGTAGGNGMTGPGNDVTAKPLTTFHGRSPDVNLMYYDPRVTYSRRINADGTKQNLSTTSTFPFNVYFYNPGSTPVYSVKDVTITSGGSNYPSSGVLASFNDAPVGGTNATATVTTAPTLNATTINVTTPGRGYPASGTTVTIGAPATGGIQATGTVNLVNSGNVASVTVNAGGRDYPATGVTATFSAPQVASGVNAAGTVNVVSRFNVQSVNIVNPGTGFPASGKTITFPAAPGTGVAATGTVTTGTVYTLTTAAVSDGGQYSSAPTVNVIGSRVVGAAPTTATATLITRYSVASVNVTAGGNYSVAPNVTFSGTRIGGSSATGTVVTGTRYQVATIPVTHPGTSNFTGNPTVTITGGSGTTATATAARVTMRNVTNVVGTGGTGCGAGGTKPVTFSTSPVYGSSAATATANISALGVVTSISFGSAGYGYSAAPVATVAGCTTQPSLTVTSNTYSGVSAITVSSAGNYTVAPTGVTITAGGGAGATASLTTSSFLTVTGVTMGANGAGYTASPTVSFSGGTGSGAAGTSVSTGYSSVNSVTFGGSLVGYTSIPALSFTGGGGSGASATANTSSATGITAINITNTGTGYTSAPTGYTLGGATGGSGQNLTLVAGTSNVITSISMTETGSGYTSSPIITLNNTGTGFGAAFTSTLGTTRTVGSITVTNPGTGYSSTPSCVITAASGSGATCTVTTGTTYVISGVTVTNAGSGYANTPVLKLANVGSGSGATFAVNTNATLLGAKNVQWNGSGTPTTAASYFTPSFNPTADSMGTGLNQLATGADTTLTYPNVVDSATSKFPKFAKRTDCAAADSCSSTEELDNYTNWYNFHSTRLDLAKTGVGLAFQPLQNTFRLGWAALSEAGKASGATITYGVRPFDSSTSIDFFSWLNGLGAPGSTPSRYAMTSVGEYFKRSDDGGPWADIPAKCNNCSTTNTGTANANHVSCRRSYSIFMTDGYYNDTKFTGQTDSDTTPVTTSSGYKYDAVGPYSDTVSGTKFTNSLADVVMKTWLNDLRPDITDDIKSDSSDPANWQHLNFSAIGLGLIGTLDSTDPDTLASLTGTGRTRDWPVPAANSQTAIDDMWHATINGRGAILNARNADELKTSIQQIVSAIAAQEDSQSGVAVSTVSLSTDTMKYTPWYTQGTWVGNVRAWHLDKSTATELCGSNTSTFNTCPPAWEVETLSAVDPITKKKTYSSLISTKVGLTGPSDTRNVYVGNGSSSGARAVAFDTSMSTSIKAVMTGAVTVDDNVINYLRGDATYEDNDFNKGTLKAVYRERTARLGDIVNSTPIFVYQNASVDYSNLPNNNGFASYWVAPTYSASTGKQLIPAGGLKGSRTEGMLFVGANDGMFHGFRNGQYVYDANGNVTSTPQAGGYESFAFIPRAILPKLNDLPSKTYSHKYYVDGPVVEVDAYINSGWKNVVLSSTGAGAGITPNPNVNSPGTSVFAIDVTNLNSSAGASSFNASNVLWEVGSDLPTAATSQFTELGYMISDVRSGPMLDDSWVAIFGNGYESKSCKAQLFIVNLATGALIKRIDTGQGDCTSNKNGLGGITLVRNDMKQIIGAYAGDLLGNMWKFNFNDASPSNWGLDLGGDALYTALPSTGTTKQPITAPPTIIDLADPNVWADGKNTAPKPGYMVVFGTGKFFETSDIANTDQQSLYGIWDDKLFGAGGASMGTRVAKSELIQQSIGATAVVTSTNGTPYYDSSKNTVDYTGKKGWYLDYNNSGERLTYPIDTLAYHYVAVGTIAPQGSINTCSGGSSGNGYLYILDALWGGMPDENVLGVPAVNGMKTKLDGRNVSLLVDDPSQYIYKVLTPEKDPLATISINKPPIPVVTKKVRKWRQLFIR